MPIVYGSLFSGIGGFDLGFARAGMQCAWQVEIDVKCQEILRRHFNVKMYSDVRSVGGGILDPINLICGGFPCQDLSVAGKREGLAGKRSGLWFEFKRIIDELKPGWIVIENVPGLLSSNQGEDFAVILQGLVECGYGVAWRIFDAQYFGVAQRRRRVFVVASLGSGRAAEILFEREGMCGDPPTRREARQEVTHAITRGSSSGYRYDPNGETFAIDGFGGYREDAGILRSSGGDCGGGSEMITICPTLNSSGAEISRLGGWGAELDFYMPQSFGVRRLTPIECARLQGFPDDWLAGESNSTQYRQLGNAVCVPVAEWIGKRIVETSNA